MGASVLNLTHLTPAMPHLANLGESHAQASQERAEALAIGLIRRFEGFRASPYVCPAGVWTIGYGHVLRDAHGKMLTQRTPQAEVLAMQGSIDRATARRYVLQDLAPIQRQTARLIPIRLHDGQWAALWSFTYNLGAGNLQTSTLRRVLLEDRFDLVPAQWMRWVFAGGRKLPGLVRRRAAELELWLQPWPLQRA